jgi:RNA-directed DNA polymerase
MFPRRTAGGTALWRIPTQSIAAQTHPQSWQTRAVPTPGHSHGQGSRRSGRGQNTLGAYLRAMGVSPHQIQDRRQCNGAAAAMGARGRDHRAGGCVFFPIRYTDDFVVLVSGTQEEAIAEKSARAEQLRRTTGLELSPEKTKVTAVKDGFEFLGFHVTMRWDQRYGYFPRVEIPKATIADLRHRIKQLTRSDTTWCALGQKLREINPILRGWAAYYRYCARAGRVFTGLDWYTTSRIWRWLRKKRCKSRVRDIMRDFRRSSRRSTRRIWCYGSIEQFVLAWTPVCRFRLGWMRTPDFVLSSGEPDAQRKAHVRFGERR